MAGIPPPVVYYYNTSLTRFLSNIGYVLNQPSRDNDGIEANSIAIPRDTVNKLRYTRGVGWSSKTYTYLKIFHSETYNLVT